MIWARCPRDRERSGSEGGCLVAQDSFQDRKGIEEGTRMKEGKDWRHMKEAERGRRGEGERERERERDRERERMQYITFVI